MHEILIVKQSQTVLNCKQWQCSKLIASSADYSATHTKTNVFRTCDKNSNVAFPVSNKCTLTLHVSAKTMPACLSYMYTCAGMSVMPALHTHAPSYKYYQYTLTVLNNFSSHGNTTRYDSFV